jgi:hypothetical protein
VPWYFSDSTFTATKYSSPSLSTFTTFAGIAVNFITFEGTSSPQPPVLSYTLFDPLTLRQDMARNGETETRFSGIHWTPHG